MSKAATSLKNKTGCYHCGDACTSERIHVEEKYFCCYGCKSVYELLNEHDLCTYYNLNEKPGIEQKTTLRKDKFAFLEDKEIQKKFIQFSNGKQAQCTFYLPQIHCSSCLWLLENIVPLNEGIISSRVNFSKKELFISFDEQKTSLREVVETLSKIGYEPHLSMADTNSKQKKQIDRSRWYKIGVAGFCFGNIMMMSLADYLSFVNSIAPNIRIFFQVMSILLALPVIFYAASEFFVSAWSGLKNRFLNIDFPVALALIITFSRSLYEIMSGTGNGYLDSMSGIVFFMLIGRWLQSRTNETISFDRDYKSFFPIALNVIKDGIATPTEISKVKEKDIIQIHANEIIPVDAILSKGQAQIDYSFVSGESLPVHVQIGELVYAGGKQVAGLLEMMVVKEVSQGYLTNLWNNGVFNKESRAKSNIYDLIAKYFTYAVLVVGVIAGLYWFYKGQSHLMWNALTSVLIVACPCALLLAQNYTNGNILRIFGMNKFYLRSPEIIDRIAKIDHIVLDKTGTVTQSNVSNVRYAGKVLNEELKAAVASLAKQSAHPASKLIFDYLQVKTGHDIIHFTETEGQGIEGWVAEQHIKLGSEAFVGGAYNKDKSGTMVQLYINGEIIGVFSIANKYRLGISQLIQSLKKSFSISLLSGDNDKEQQRIESLLGPESDILFNQSPQQKLNYIEMLQNDEHRHVMMVGDGLNDAGALKQSDVGIAVADTRNNFSPASDGVIDAGKLFKLDAFIQFAKNGRKIILLTFSISVIYNLIGLYFAVQGNLSPVIAAILMPCSSISIILLTYGLSNYLSHQLRLNDYKQN